MPGAVQAMTRGVALGWARHPTRVGYPVIVNLVLRARVVRSVMADQDQAAGLDGAGGQSGFTVALADLDLDAADHARLRFVIGETDELLATPDRPGRPPGDALSLEDVLSLGSGRAWVDGSTWHDAEEAGLPAADIIDLLYRDILGRAADPSGLADYLRRLRSGDRTYDQIRKSLLESGEYAARDIPAMQAPGAIFSQRIVLHAGSALRAGGSLRAGGAGPGGASPFPAPRRVDVGPLLSLAPEAFLSRVYRDVLRRRTERVAFRRQLDRLAAGASPLDLLEELVDAARIDGLEIELHHSSPAPGEAEPLGTIEIGAASPLFEDGWYNAEIAPDGTYRWMGESGTVVNPHPQAAVAAVLIRIRSLYGTDFPTLRCFADEAETEAEAEAEESGFAVRLRLGGKAGARFGALRILSLASGCPLREGKGSDGRTLSLLVAGVAFTYTGPDDAGAAPPAGGAPPAWP